jgi:hypothetical protein
MSHIKTPISEKQLAANRANASKSTGPKTPEGKARSSQNSLKHGFTGSTFAVVRLEDLQEIARLKSDLMDVYKPVNSQEVIAIERMALAQQSIFRAGRLEAGLFTTCMNETMDSQNQPYHPMSRDLVGDGDILITRAMNRNYCLADGFENQVRKSNVWPLFIRYQAHAERQYRRALEEFERLKALRPELPNEEIPNEPVADLQPTPEADTYLDPEIDRCCGIGCQKLWPVQPAPNPETAAPPDAPVPAAPDILPPLNL